MHSFLSYLFACSASFIVCVTAIVVLQPLARKIQLVDSPGGRKTHDGNIPLIGGVAMFLAVITGAYCISMPSQYRMLLLGGGVLVATGMLDDYCELGAKARLCIQLVVLVLMIHVGKVHIVHLGALLPAEYIAGSHLGIPFTLFAAASLINAINMTDGVDGLAGILSLNTLFALFISLTLRADGGGSDMAMILIYIASLVGFLCFNLRLPWRKNAVVFMGDAGSLFLGFSLAWFSISLTQNDSSGLAPVTMLWLFTVPLFDMLTVFIRRLRKRKSPFHANRDHFHHLLLAKGYSTNQTVMILSCFSILSSTIGIVSEVMHYSEFIRFSLFLGCYTHYYCWARRTHNHMWHNKTHGQISVHF